MRIPSFVAALAAAFTLAFMGCGTTAADDPARLEAAEVKASQQGLGICSQAWTCDYTHWYSTQSTCLANCPSAPTEGCYRDYNCNGRCICP